MRNLQQTLNWTGPFINFQPLTIGGSEPALSNANLILQTILGPPFAWRWNRAEVSFNITQPNVDNGLQDYIVAAPRFGFIEKAWIVQGAELKEIKVQNVLAPTKEKARPHTISVQGDDNAGNITFRVTPAPNVLGVVTVVYQLRAPLMSSVASTWSPIPDDYSYIYQWGFLALAAMMIGDSRFPIYNQKFMAHLLGAQDGLDETARNIFLGNWLEITKEAQRATGKANQGVGSRQM
jgi:hypothetical protein